MGQYGFYVPSTLPSWADTWEFDKWMNDPLATFFPSFSIYTRLAGELGATGYIVWVVSSYYLLAKTVAAAQQFKKSSNRNPYIGLAVASSIWGLVLIGWNSSSYKVFNIWFTFGTAVAYVRAPHRMEPEAVANFRGDTAP